MLHVRGAAARRSPEEIVAKAGSLLDELSAKRSSGFIAERLRKLRLLMQMISDLEWRLPHAEVQRVLNALAYFYEPDDLIPDDIPGVGYLDDAIMIELVTRELAPEIGAYEEFCEFRRDTPERTATEVARVRETLQQRMRMQRETAQDSSSAKDVSLLD
jgi:uncharacterized membrane protein YkvA (DUF1232 family)